MEIDYLKLVLAIISGFFSAWQIWLLLGTLLLVGIIISLYQRHRLGKSGIYEVDRMTGDEFEEYLSILFEKLGYLVEKVGSHKGDYGADLIIEKNKERTAIQAKRHDHWIGIEAVREVYGSMNMYNCTKAMVITNNYYTDQAKKLALADKVELWDRRNLIDALLSVGNKNTVPDGLSKNT